MQNVKTFKIAHREYVSGAERDCPHCGTKVNLDESDPRNGSKITNEYSISIPYQKQCPYCHGIFDYVVVASRSKKRP